MNPWNASNSSVVVVGLLIIMLNGTLNANLLILLCYCYLLNFMTYKNKLFHLKATPTRAFNEFLYEFYDFFKFRKIR